MDVGDVHEHGDADPVTLFSDDRDAAVGGRHDAGRRRRALGVAVEPQRRHSEGDTDGREGWRDEECRQCRDERGAGVPPSAGGDVRN